MRRPANHSTHVETGRRMRRPYEALSPALSAGGFQTPRYHFQTAAIKGPSYFVGATHASPCKPQHACRNGATHASPLRSFVTGPICGRGSTPPLSVSNPPLSKVPLTSQGDACVALQPQHACRNGATHASPLRSFVTGLICGRVSNPPLSFSNPPLSKVPLTS